MKETYYCWVLSFKFDGERLFLGSFCWCPPHKAGVPGVAIFRTRKLARRAQKTCCYGNTRVERIEVVLKSLKP